MLVELDGGVYQILESLPCRWGEQRNLRHSGQAGTIATVYDLIRSKFGKWTLSVKPRKRRKNMAKGRSGIRCEDVVMRVPNCPRSITDSAAAGAPNQPTTTLMERLAPQFLWNIELLLAFCIPINQLPGSLLACPMIEFELLRHP